MSIDEIRKRASNFEKKIFWRNVREYAGSAMAIALFVWFIIDSHDTFFRIACGLMIAGLLCMAFQLRRLAWARSMPADLGAANALQFHRSELERQQDFLAHIWKWYVAPLLPGLAAFSLQSVLMAPHRLLRAVLVNSLFALSLIVVWRLNTYATRCLRRKINELHAVEVGE